MPTGKESPRHINTYGTARGNAEVEGTILPSKNEDDLKMFLLAGEGGK
jgi:hypothetical protein